MTTVIYRGPFRDGVHLVHADGIHCPYLVPVDVPDELAAAVLAEQPDNFTTPKPAKPVKES